MPCLDALSGVGPTLAEKIRSAYGTDDAFFAACKQLDLDRLLALEGLSERRAFEIAAQARGGVDLARTARAKEIRRELEDLLASFAHTSYGQRAVRLLPILTDAAAIHASANRVMETRQRLESLDRAQIAASLSRLHRLRDPPRRSIGRIILVENEDEEIALRERGLDAWCRIATGRAGIREIQGAESVVSVWSSSADLDEAENIVPGAFTDPNWRFVPEVELDFVAANRACIEATATLAQILGRPSVAPRVLEAADRAQRPVAADVRSAAKAALAAAQAAFTETVGSLSLSGTQILELLSDARPKALEPARRQALDAGSKAFQSAAGFAADVFEEGLPLRIDEAEIARLQARERGRSGAKAFADAREAARIIHEARAILREEWNAWLRFDVEQALATYALTFDAQPATSSARLVLQGAINLRLARKSRPEPISYELGGPHPVAVLTGANSGGKSSLLELLAQFVLLHHWGLPVPARSAEIPSFDELLVFGGVRALDAGAFETFLRELFPPLAEPGRKLVLLDEVESATELEAAGRILGVFLDEVARTDSLCLLVTHLPGEVLAHARRPVRIDGIDAIGLDENFNLLVDRQPKLNHRARSTPELILRRVHAKAQGKSKALYAKILARWDESPAPRP